MLIGVQHFFLLSNECDPTAAAAARAVLEPYIQAGHVSLSTRCGSSHTAICLRV